MGQLIDLTGRRFGKLTVLGRGKTIVRPRGSTILYWVCECDCGSTIEAVGGDLRSGRTLSCGCYQREASRRYHTKHGACGTRLYEIWTGMKQRCGNPNKLHYDRYGGRGISVCSDWLEYERFNTWALANGYRDDLTIDRIDNDGNYCPENCRWVPVEAQANNKRNNHYIEFNGETRTLAEWAKASNIAYHTFHSRMARGWPMERILRTPVRGSVNVRNLT